MAKIYAECNIVISPLLAAKAGRKRMAAVDMEIISSQSANTPKPITLVIKDGDFARVMELMTAYRKPDDELAAAIRKSVLASEVEGKTDEEVAAWARQNVIDELQGMA